MTRTKRPADPETPAYDNPVGNKGRLAAGNNVRQRARPAPSAKPQGHDSDTVLGQKPTEERGPMAGGTGGSSTR